MGVAGVDHGYDNHSCGQFTAKSITGNAVGIGTFTATAAGVTTVTDTNIPAGAEVVFCPANAAAGLLVKSNSCYIGTGAGVAGSFTFVVSATGVGAPAGSEVFTYFFISET